MFLAKVVANHGFVQAFSVEQELRDVLLAAADALVVNEELDALDGEEGLGVYCRGGLVCGEMVVKVKEVKRFNY